MDAMEEGCAFLPPGVVTQESYQNSMIRGIKTNSLPHPYEHRACTVNTPTSYSQAILFYNAHRFGTQHVDSHLRRRHFRRIYDLVHVCLLRRKVELAARFLKVLIQAHEWNHDLEWRMGLLLVALTPQAEPSTQTRTLIADYDSSNASAKLKFLSALDLSATYHFKATRLTEETVVEYIASSKLVEAIELLESRVSIWPYKNEPSLHCYLGMLYLFVGVQKLLSVHQQSTQESEGASIGVDIRRLDRATRNKCRDCFTQVLYSTENWTALELRRRQRIYYMYRKDLLKSERRPVLKQKRDIAWGVDLTRDIPEVAAETQEQEDDADDEDADPDETITAQTENPPEPLADGEGEAIEAEGPTAGPKSGPKFWPKHWPEVEDVWQIEKPWAWYIAREFLDLLFPGNNYTSATAAPAPAEESAPELPLASGFEDPAVRQFYIESSEDDSGSEQGRRASPVSSRSKRKRDKSDAEDKPASREHKHKHKSSSRHRSKSTREDGERPRHSKKAKSVPVAAPASGSTDARPGPSSENRSRHKHGKSRKEPARPSGSNRGF